MCKDKKWTVGLLTRDLPSLPATEQNLCVKIKSGRVFSFGRRQVSNPCVKIKWTVGLLTRGLPSLSAAEQNQCVKINSGRAFSFGRRQVTNPRVNKKSGRRFVDSGLAFNIGE